MGLGVVGEGVGVGRKGLRRAADVLSGDAGMSGFPTIEGGLLLVPTSPLRQPYSTAVRSDRRPGQRLASGKRAKSGRGQRLAQAPLSK